MGKRLTIRRSIVKAGARETALHCGFRARGSNPPSRGFRTLVNTLDQLERNCQLLFLLLFPSNSVERTPSDCGGPGYDPPPCLP